jgi:hypothetical protein
MANRDRFYDKEPSPRGLASKILNEPAAEGFRFGHSTIRNWFFARETIERGEIMRRERRCD